MKIAIVIGHYKLSKGAYSEYLKRSEYELYKGFECELKEIADVFTHSQFTKSYTRRQIEMAERTKDYNLVIELHFNKFDTIVNGCEALYFKENKETKRIAKGICKKYAELSDVKNRGAKSLIDKKQRGFGFLKNQKVNAIILEPFFGDNLVDCSKFEINNLIKAIIMNLQDNVKLIQTDFKHKKATYDIVDKKTNDVITTRYILTNETDETEIAKDCQDDYCEWYRKGGGRNTLRNLYA